MRRSTRATVHAALVAAALGAGAAGLLAAAVLPGWAQNATSAVAIDNFTFKPQQLTVKSGTKITWTNKDDVPHTVVSTNKAFPHSPALDTDESFSYTFAKAGTYDYYCSVHPKMVGKVVVQ